jgi:hypothetical protein
MYTIKEYYKELELEEKIEDEIFSKNILFDKFTSETEKNNKFFSSINKFKSNSIDSLKDYCIEEPNDIIYKSISTQSLFSKKNNSLKRNIILVKRSHFNRKVLNTIYKTEGFLLVDENDTDFGFLIPYWVSQFESEIKERILAKFSDESKEYLLNILPKIKKAKWQKILEPVLENKLKVTFGVLYMLVYTFEKAMLVKDSPIYELYLKIFNQKNSDFFTENQLSGFINKMVETRNNVVHNGLTLDKKSYINFCASLFGNTSLGEWLFSPNNYENQLSAYLESLPKTLAEIELEQMELRYQEILKSGNSSIMDSNEWLAEFKIKREDIDSI